MSPKTIVAWGLLLVVVLAGVTYLRDPEPTRAGQIIFKPWESAESLRIDSGIGTVGILSCSLEPKGLAVRGRVAPQPGVTSVVVVPGDDQGVGVGVSTAFAEHSRLLAGATSGDFYVVLPWGTPEASFALVAADSFVLESAAVRSGPFSGCP